MILSKHINILLSYISILMVSIPLNWAVLSLQARKPSEKWINRTFPTWNHNIVSK